MECLKEYAKRGKFVISILVFQFLRLRYYLAFLKNVSSLNSKMAATFFYADSKILIKMQIFCLCCDQVRKGSVSLLFQA
jgi:hypothetical protein